MEKLAQRRTGQADYLEPGWKCLGTGLRRGFAQAHQRSEEKQQRRRSGTATPVQESPAKKRQPAIHPITFALQAALPCALRAARQLTR